MTSSCHFFFNHSVLLCPSLYSTNLHNTVTAPNCTALVRILFSTANRFLISLYYSTHKVFKSHVISSQTDFFFNYKLPAAISYRQLLLLPTGYAMNLFIQPWYGQASKETVSTVVSHKVSCDRYHCVASPRMCCIATIHEQAQGNHFQCCCMVQALERAHWAAAQQCLEQIRHNTVACRHTARHRPQGMQIYKTHYWVLPSQTNMSPWQWIHMQQQSNCWKWSFPCSPCQGYRARMNEAS
jgi:hypothetical protein